MPGAEWTLPTRRQDLEIALAAQRGERVLRSAPRMRPAILGANTGQALELVDAYLEIMHAEHEMIERRRQCRRGAAIRPSSAIASQLHLVVDE